MGFYSDPAFFICAIVIALPAVILGMLGKASRGYGIVVSVIFLAALFCRDLTGALFLLVSLAVSSVCCLAALSAFRGGSGGKSGTYALLVIVALLPLIVAEVGSVFDANFPGFIGLAYLTLKSVQVVIEAHDGVIEEMRFADLLYLLIFFPVFTSGPLMRAGDFLRQVKTPPTGEEYRELFACGLTRFVRGLLYCFVFGSLLHWLQWSCAEWLGTGIVSTVFGPAVQALCYGLCLFFDFAGYSLMALGLGAVLGIRVPDNFRAPFAATDIKDFWNRWHISLSSWLRDYVYTRLSRAIVSRSVLKSELVASCLSFICTMGLMGLWHGLSANFVLYGLYHGVLLAVCDVWQCKSSIHRRNRQKRWYKSMTWAFTMVAVFFGFALFSGQVTGVVTGGSHG